MGKPKGATSYRLSEDAQTMLAALAEQFGVSKTGVLEIAIRKLAGIDFGGTDHDCDRVDGGSLQSISQAFSRKSQR